MLNVRSPVRFAFVRGGLQFPMVAAWSEALTPTRTNQPLQAHLSLTTRPGEVAAQWTTRDEGAAPAVQWGPAPGAYASSAAATSPTYTRADMCGAPANASGWLDPGVFHRAVMTGLRPGQRYFYRYGDPAAREWSEEASFLAPPDRGPGSTVRLLAVADLGQAEVDGSLEVSQTQAALGTAARLAAEAATGRFNALLHNGDVSYARGFSSQWDVFWDQMAPVATAMPYMTAIGNHERDWPGTGSAGGWDSGGECGVAYERRTQMPGTAPDAPWYAFDVGPVHFLQYSTEHPFAPGSPQHDFIRSDLTAVDRGATPWVVVGGHRPMYVDSVDFPLWPAPDHDQTMARALRAALEGLFFEHGMDVTLHGHHHSYQRTCAVYEGQCRKLRADGSAAAPVHLVIGHAGAGLSPNVHLVKPAMYERVLLRHGYLRVEANATHLGMEAVASDDGTVMDELMLVKGRGVGFGGSTAEGRGHPERVSAHRKDALGRVQ